MHKTDDPNIKASKDVSADVEKQADWTATATQELTAKRHTSLLRNIRYQVMSMYRRLFTVILLLNLVVAIVFAATKTATPDRLAGACLGNLTVTVVMRHDHVVNVLFRSFSSIPQSWPLWFRRRCAKIYSFGGVHSGCAVFGVVWLIWLTGNITQNFVTVRKVCF